MTFIVPKGGLEEAYLRDSEPIWLPLLIGMMQKLFQPSFSDQLVQMIPQGPTVFYGVSPVLVVLIMKALITPHWVFPHLIWPFKKWLILDLFQNLVHQFLEYFINCLGIGRPCLPSKIPPRSIVSLMKDICLSNQSTMRPTYPMLHIQPPLLYYIEQKTHLNNFIYNHS